MGDTRDDNATKKKNGSGRPVISALCLDSLEEVTEKKTVVILACFAKLFEEASLEIFQIINCETSFRLNPRGHSSLTLNVNIFGWCCEVVFLYTCVRCI